MFSCEAIIHTPGFTPPASQVAGQGGSFHSLHNSCAGATLSVCADVST